VITLFPYLVFGAVMFLVGFGCCLAIVLMVVLARHLKPTSKAEPRPDWDAALAVLLDPERRR
jgi:hypothetical protein